MADIYSQASQVLVYLNYPDHGVISELVEHLIKISRGTKTEARAIGRPLLGSFLENPWFDRVWVLQEIFLAKLVALHVDDQIIHWDRRTVDELITLCEDLDYDPPGVLRWLPATQREGNDSLDLLHRARHCMATDARDKLFALYSLFPASFQDALPVDYALNIEEVFSNFATCSISSTKRLDVLKHVSPYQTLDLGSMSSWVPHWDIRQVVDTKLPSFTVSQMRKFAVPDSSSIPMETSSDTGIQLSITHETLNGPSLWFRYQLSQSSEDFPVQVYAFPCLRVRGYLLDEVITHDYHLPPSGEVQNSGLQFPDPDSMPGLNPRIYPEPVLKSGIFRFCSEHSKYADREEVMPGQYRSNQIREVAGVREAMISLTGEKRVFTTEQSWGYVLCPINQESSRHRPEGLMRIVEPGDTIWALEGLDVPVVLRRNNREGSVRYVLVGPCYLHRAGLNHECPVCGSESQPWPMEYATIDIW